MANIQDTIRGLRAVGYSQSEIARQIGLEQASVWRWENGKAPNSAEAVLKLARLAANAKRRSPRPKAAA